MGLNMAQIFQNASFKNALSAAGKKNTQSTIEAVGGDYVAKKKKKNAEYISRQNAVIDSLNAQNNQYAQAKVSLNNAFLKQQRTQNNKAVRQGIGTSSIATALRQQVAAQKSSSEEALSQKHTDTMNTLQSKLTGLQSQRDAAIAKLEAARQKAVKAKNKA